MREENDWRLMGQEKFLMNVPLVKADYSRWSEKWDHDHCAFCTETFSEYDGDLHDGYCMKDKYWWICNECYEDFKDMFNWTQDDNGKQ